MITVARRTLVLVPAMFLAISAGVPTEIAASPSPTTSATPASLPPIDCPAGMPLATGSIASIAGVGTTWGDGGQAIDASVNVTVGGLAVDDTGTVLFSGYYQPRIRRVGVDGIISTIADPAAGAPFVQSSSLALDAAGDVYIADPDSARIWRLDPTGAVSAFAGSGSAGSTGDGGPALDAAIQPTHVATGPDGSVYLDDGARVRVITPDGTIHAFAGTGTSGSSGDGGPAVDAQLGGSDQADESCAEVMGMVADAAGDVFLADNGNQRIRKVDRNGIITTVAGTGERGYSGDGGPALAATFEDPVDLALDAEGNLYVSDHHNSVVRRVDTSGKISTVAGSLPAGAHPAADCGPATEAYLVPWAIDVHAGYLYIGDMIGQGVGRIRVVRL